MNRVHINKLNTQHKILEKLHKYYYKEKMSSLFFSKQGLFALENGEMYKINITDNHVIKRNNYHKDFNLWVDSSKIQKKNNIQQLPFQYVTKKIKEMHYRLHENATMTFCVELSDNKICDYYFLTNEDIDNFSIKKDIVTFLSLLN